MLRLPALLTALRELGPTQMGLYARYRFDLKTGLYSRDIPPAALDEPGIPFKPALPVLPLQEDLLDCISPEGAAAAVQAGEEIVAGKVRLFGGEPVALCLAPEEPLYHWTAYELGHAGWGVEDPKFLWEPARFGWAFSLARAWVLNKDKAFAQAFWDNLESFLSANPLYQGPNWASGQEVALRLIALAFAGQVFAQSPESTPQRMQMLAQTIAGHAARIPPTLVYARSQHNNHLLSEAAGLLTASACLPNHPQSTAWRKTGWRWLNRGLQSQISPGGVYAQHSTNYQRLMLSLAVWASAVARIQRLAWPEATRQKLAAATRWLLGLVDPGSGCVPNLGPNDGALVLPLSGASFTDYRPVLQAAACLFLGRPAFPPGPYDELSLWLQIPTHHGTSGNGPPAVLQSPATNQPAHGSPPSPLVLRGEDSWAYLRVARFNSRPGHADQLHLDLWWRGLNLAQDPGTYRYTAPQPWDNALSGTAFHNTLTLGEQDQMKRAGKFLYLGWAQGKILDYHKAADGSWERLEATHDGYRHMGYNHRRVVERRGDRWKVVDSLVSTRAPSAGAVRIKSEPVASVHWLFPDWPFEIEAGESRVSLKLESPSGPVQVLIDPAANYMGPLSTRLVRAGEVLCTRGSFPAEARPTLGWVSPTYNSKQPALSLTIEFGAMPQLALQTAIVFPS